MIPKFDRFNFLLSLSIRRTEVMELPLLQKYVLWAKLENGSICMGCLLTGETGKITTSTSLEEACVHQD
jgi:hypothetical protein